MLTKESVEAYRQLAYLACGNFAKGLNAGNAHQYAAQHLARLTSAGRGIEQIQSRGQVDLSSILTLADEEKAEALAAFAGGCWSWLVRNPD